MKESNLLKIALLCSLIGLLVLFFISTKIDVKEFDAGTLSKNMGDDVKLIGTVTKISDRGEVVFIEVNRQSRVTVVLFTDENNLKLNDGDTIEVIGEVQEHNKKLEIIAQKIRVLR